MNMATGLYDKRVTKMILRSNMYGKCKVLGNIKMTIFVTYMILKPHFKVYKTHCPPNKVIFL